MSKIVMPSFDDFLADMGQRRIMEWVDEANESGFQMDVQFPVDQETVTKFVTGITSLNVKFTIAMLRDYHEWMTEQLARRSVHLLK